MAVQDEDSFKRYAANGVATVYAIPFLLLSDSDLQVTLDAVPVTSGFTVSGVGSNTGSITFDAAPTGDLLLQRVVPFERLTDYQDNGDLLAQTVNRDFDRLWLAMQELRRDDGTALRTSFLEPEGTSTIPLVAARALRVLGFGSSGEPVVSTLTLAELEQQPALALSSAAAAAASADEASSSEESASNSAQAAEVARDEAVSALSGLNTRVTTLESTDLVSSVAQATTSGTAIDFIGIRAGVKRISVMLSGVSTNGSSVPQLQLGAGSLQTSGYVGAASGLVGGTASASYASGAIIVNNHTSAMTHSGVVRFSRVSGNTWVVDGVIGRGDSSATSVTGGTVTLTGTLDRIRLTTVNGTDTFDAGTVNIMYEG